VIKLTYLTKGDREGMEWCRRQNGGRRENRENREPFKA